MNDKEKLLSILKNQESGCWTDAEYKEETEETTTYINITSHGISFAFNRFTDKFLYIVNYKE